MEFETAGELFETGSGCIILTVFWANSPNNIRNNWKIVPGHSMRDGSVADYEI